MKQMMARRGDNGAEAYTGMSMKSRVKISFGAA